jgi:TorA maturation chaperone TorD
MSTWSEPLECAAIYRFFSVAFMTPSPQWAEDLVNLATEFPLPLCELAEKLANEAAQTDTAELEGMYHQLIGAQKQCGCCESDYLPQGRSNRGALLGDIAGFYKAFSFDHTTELSEVPDHICVEFSFLSFLAIKESFARFQNHQDNAELCQLAQNKFLAEHFDLWFSQFAENLKQVAGDSFYERTVELAETALTPVLEEARQFVQSDAGACDSRFSEGTCLPDEMSEGCQSCFVMQRTENIDDAEN